MSQGHSNEAVEDGSENVHTFVVNIDSSDATESGNDLGRPSLLKSASSPGKAAYSTRRPSLRRAQSIKDKFSVGTAKFFGLPAADYQDDDNPRVEASTVKTPDQQKWLQRRFRHLKKQYGVKPEAVAEELEPSTAIGIDALGLVEFPPPAADSSAQSNGYAATSKNGIPRPSDGRLMRAAAGKGLLERRESVMKMAYETFNSVIQGNAFRKSRQRVAEGNRSDALADKSRSSSVRRPNLIANSSFPANPLRMAVPTAVESGLVTMKATARAASHGRFTEHARMPEQQPADYNDAPTTRAPAKPKLSRIRGLAFDDTIAQEPLRAESPTPRPTSLALQAEMEARNASKVRFEETSFGGEAPVKKPLTAQYTSLADDEVFFDMTPSTTRCRPTFSLGNAGMEQSGTPKIDPSGHVVAQKDAAADLTAASPPAQEQAEVLASGVFPRTTASEAASSKGGRRIGLHPVIKEKEKAIAAPTEQRGWRIWPIIRGDNVQAVAAGSFRSLSKLLSGDRRSRRRRNSLPMYGRRKKARGDAAIAKLEDESLDYRPFFTYWVTTVQVIVMIFALLRYGVGTDYTNGGLSVIERSGDVLASSLSIVHIVVWEQNNVWFGPRFADLVHMGAKYTPCMRPDARILEQIHEERRIESTETGCCVVLDSCFQTSECPSQFGKSLTWINDTSSSRRIVCGQDPRYCRNPRSIPPFEWSTDISKWPICTERSEYIPKQEKHMHCEITGRPCCIQMHGQCRITTREYCDFVRGYYHENATLCSQVSCLNDVCGLTPFLRDDMPDQFYRLFIPLFIHAGLVRCAITVFLQLKYMRRFERMIGWFRLSIIYFLSGIGGYLASATFVPYMPEVGPAGSLGGVLGALIIDVLYNWKFVENPRKALLVHISIAVVLFLTGFLPYIDNWAQVFGFFFGCLLAAALIPYINFGSNVTGRQARQYRLMIVIGALLVTLLLFAILFTLFYGFPVIDHPALGLLNCPFPGKVCDHQGLILRNWLPI